MAWSLGLAGSLTGGVILDGLEDPAVIGSQRGAVPVSEVTDGEDAGLSPRGT